MFTTKVKKEPSLPSSSVSILGAGNIFTGDFKCNGDLRVDGTVKGSIHSKAKVIIGLSGFIEGDIYCNEADITGKVTGNIFTKTGLILKQSATLYGDAHTPKFIIEPAATFNGKSFMDENKTETKVDNTVDKDLEQPAKLRLRVVGVL